MSDSPTFQEKVNAAVAEVKRDDAGKLQFPDDMDEAMQYSVTAEVRRRDTQSALDRERQSASALKTENEKLASGWEQDVTKTLTAEQRNELDELKATDPDTWREKMDSYEAENRTKFRETRESISKEAQEGTELEQREAAMEQFNKDNPDIQLTDEVIENDLPPRLLKQLEKGDVDFNGFLANVKTYLTSGKVVKAGDKPTEIEDLGNAGGSNTPSEDAIEAAAKQSYENEFF